MYEEKLSSLEKKGIKLEENELEEFISEYIENNTYTISNIIEDTYEDVMINRFVDPKYKRIIQGFKDIYDRYRTIPNNVNYI